jgi:hypothetical protein
MTQTFNRFAMFPTWLQSQSITDVLRFLMGMSSTNRYLLYFLLFSAVCSNGPQASSKTSEIGTFPEITLLKLSWGPGCMTRIIRLDAPTPSAGVNHLQSRSMYFLTNGILVMKFGNTLIWVRMLGENRIASGCYATPTMGTQNFWLERGDVEKPKNSTEAHPLHSTIIAVLPWMTGMSVLSRTSLI